MLRLLGFWIVALTLVSSVACKRKLAEKPSQQELLKGKPDKVSEEPTGLPGYPLLCRWVQGPASDTLEAALNCFLADDKAQPASLRETLSWSASAGVYGTLVQKTEANQTLSLTVKSSSRDQLALAIQNMTLKAESKGLERSASGREAVKADSQKIRLAASCRSLFTLAFVTDVGAFSYLELSRFTGCEQLATALQNAQVPDGQSRSLPALHKTVQASCKDGFFQLTINQPEFQGSSSQGPMDPGGCEDLKGLVNNLGL